MVLPRIGIQGRIMEKTQNNYLLGDREPPEAVDDHGGEIGDLGDDDDPGEVMLIWAQLLAKLSSLGVLYCEDQVKCVGFFGSKIIKGFWKWRIGLLELKLDKLFFLNLCPNFGRFFKMEHACQLCIIDTAKFDLYILEPTFDLIPTYLR